MIKRVPNNLAKILPWLLILLLLLSPMILLPSHSWLLPVVIVAALADSINPCAFSILFLTIAFLFNLGRSRKNILLTGGLYIAGLFLVYLLIGLGLLQALSFFNIPNLIAKIGALIVISAGLINLINVFFPHFPIKLKIPSSSHPALAKLIEKASAPTAIALGVLVGLFEFPCTGGPYLFVLTLIHSRSTFGPGLLFLVLYNLIFVSPLILILVLSSNPALLEKAKTLRKHAGSRMQILGSAVMIAVGLTILLFL